MGCFNKLVLVFPSVFWDPEIDSFGYVNGSPTTHNQTYADSRGRHYLFWNIFHTTKQPILVSFICGKAAIDMGDDDEIALEALRILSRIYKEIPAPINYLVTRWASDPFTKGSYTSIRPDGSGEDYDIIAQPLANKLFFAGEGT